MKSWSIFSTLAAALILTASPGFAGHDRASGTTPGDRTSAPYGGAVTGPELTDPTEAASGPSIEGQVAAVEYDSGRLVLDTEDGPIGMRVDPDELRGVEIGDIVRVSLVTGEDNSGSQ